MKIPLQLFSSLMCRNEAHLTDMPLKTNVSKNYDHLLTRTEVEKVRTFIKKMSPPHFNECNMSVFCGSQHKKYSDRIHGQMWHFTFSGCVCIVTCCAYRSFWSFIILESLRASDFPLVSSNSILVCSLPETLIKTPDYSPADSFRVIGHANTELISSV